MMGSWEIAAAIAIKAVGSFIGAALAIVFLPPKTVVEGLRRLLFSIVIGAVFGGLVREMLKWEDTFQANFVALVLTAMFSWFIMAAALRIINSYKMK